MNKKLLALAVAGAFVAPVAMADSSNVTVYGSIGMSIDSVDGGSSYTGAQADADTNVNVANSDAGAAARLVRAAGNESVNAAERRGRVSSNNSYIGFKGSEDLGNGMSAIWQYEFGVAFDRQTINNEGATPVSGTQSKRNTFAGVASKSWGSLTFGVQDTPTKTSTGKLDQFKDTVADYRTFIGGMGGSVRAESSVLYATPNFNGFTGKALYGFKNEGGNGSKSDPKIYSLSGTYENGPIFAVLAYEDNKEVRSINPTTGGGSNISNVELFGIDLGIPTVHATAATYSAALFDGKMKTTRAGFGYNFGAAKVGLVYERSKLNGDFTSNWAVPATVATNRFDVKRNTWYLSGSYDVTKSTKLKAAYTRAGKLTGNVDGASIDSGDSGAKQWTVGVEHALSKRTSVYALYTTVRNDNDAAYSLAGGATGIATVGAADVGEDPRAISIGMRHSF